MQLLQCIYIYSTLLVIFLLKLNAKEQLPDKFYGKWKLGENSENYDEYLAEKGVPWIVRKIIENAACTRIFTKRDNGLFQFQIHTKMNNVDWEVELGKQFTADYLDEKAHKITITYDSKADKLVEEHIKPDTNVPEIYEYHFNGSNEMYMTMQANNVTAKRYYSRID